MMSDAISIRLFKNRFDKFGEEHETTRAAWIARLLASAEVGPKNKLTGWSPARFTPCVGPCDDRVEHGITKPGCHGQRPHRRKVNAYDLSAITLDYESKDEALSGTPLDDIESLWRDYSGLIYTSASHTAERPRARVLIWLSRLVDAREFAIVAGVIYQRARAGGHLIDEVVDDPSRFWYAPTAAAERRELGGALLDVDALLALHAPEPLAPSPARRDSHAHVRPTVRHEDAPVDLHSLEERHPYPVRVRRASRWLAKRGPAIEGEHGGTHTFKTAAILVRGFLLTEDSACEMMVGWNKSCEPPWTPSDLRRKVSEGAHASSPAMGEYLERKPERSMHQVSDDEYEREERIGMGGDPDGAWPTLPVDERSASAKEFPVDALPEAIARWVSEEAEETQTPPAMAGCFALAALAAAAAKRASVRVMGNYFEPLNIFTAVALPPADRKSAVFERAFEPLRTQELRLAEATEAERTNAKVRKEVIEIRLRSAKAKATKTHAWNEVQGLIQELSELKVPPVPKLFATDITPESLATVLAEQGGAIAVIAAEGGIVDVIAGRYSKTSAPNLDVFLNGHAGDHIRIDRRDRSETVRRPALTVALAIQPSVLAAMGAQREFKDRGLLARFLFCTPETLVGSRKANPVPMSEDAERGYAELISAVLSIGRVVDFATGDDAHVIHLSGEALSLRHQYANYIEPRLKVGVGDLDPTGGWGGKLPGAVVRLAGLLHMAKHAASGAPWRIALDGETMSNAIRLGEFFLSHAIKAFGVIERGTEESPVDVVVKAIKKIGKRIITRRELHHRLKHLPMYRTVDSLTPMLVTLLENEYIIERESVRGKKGGRPSVQYEVHPGLVPDGEGSK